MLETRKNDQHVINEHRHEWRNKTRRESSAEKCSTHRRNTHHRSRATGRHCNHAMIARVRKRARPNKGTHPHALRSTAPVSGASSTPRSQPPNAPHSRADLGRPRHEPPNPAHPHQGKTHEQHPGLGKPLYLSSFNQPRATDTGRGHEKRAHPEMRGARDADETNNITPTLTRATTRIPTIRRNMSHKRQGSIK